MFHFHREKFQRDINLNGPALELRVIDITLNQHVATIIMKIHVATIISIVLK